METPRHGDTKKYTYILYALVSSCRGGSKCIPVYLKLDKDIKYKSAMQGTIIRVNDADKIKKLM